MLFYGFAYRLIFLFGLIVLTVVLVLAAKFGWLGETLGGLVTQVLTPAQEFYLQNRNDIELTAKIVGAVGTALGAAWTVYVGWHYAERNLPKRIEDFNARWKDDVEAERPRTILALANGISIAIEVDGKPSFLKRLMHFVHDPSRWELAKSERVLAQCKDDFKVLTTSRVRCRAQLVSAHLDAGARFSLSGKSADALDRFEQAVRINSSDMDALELAARQAFAHGQTVLAGKYLEKLAGAAATSGHVCRRSKAMRFHAEVLKGGGERDRMRARDTLKAAIAILRAPDVRDEKAKELELCLVHGQLADVQSIRNTLHGARTALNQANAHHNQLHPASRREVKEWLDEIDRRLTQAERDRDKDDERNEDGDKDAPTSDTPHPADGAS
jgi:tetratricopeptide (TPR) repeat protein